MTALVANTTLAKIIHAVEAAQGNRAPTQRIVDRFARVYTPEVCVTALLMDDDLRKLPTFIRLSRATLVLLTQNIAFALLVKVVFIALTFAGHATMWMAVFADMGASLLVVFNGLRLLRK